MLTFEEHLRELVVAVDAEIDALERRLKDLREYRRLTLDIGQLAAHARDRVASRAAATKPPAAEPEPRRTYAPRAAMTVEDVLDAARTALAAGPTTVAGVFQAMGKSPQGRSHRQRATVEEALQQLGAVKVGTGHSGATLWALPKPAEPAPESEPEPEPARAARAVARERDLDAEIEQAYQERGEPASAAVAPSDEELVAAVLELTATAVGWSDGELRYKLKRRGIDVPVEEVRRAREVATQRRMKARARVGTAGRT